MGCSMSRSRSKKKKDEDFVPKNYSKRALQDVGSEPVRKAIRLKEKAVDDSYDKNVAHLFSMSDAEFDEATQVSERVLNAYSFFTQNAPTSLQSAAAVGDLAAVKRIIATGVRIDECDAGGQTALFLATEQGHVEVVRELLWSFANPDTINYRHGQRLGSPMDLVAYMKTSPNYQQMMALFLDHQLEKFNPYENLIMPKFY
jgi:ankyrin repeat protein